jgi:hypothetical protein
MAKANKQLGDWIEANRGMLATLIAMGTCLVPAVGWVACAVVEAAAYGVRVQQRAEDEGGLGNTWRADAADGLYTTGTLGLGAALRVSRFGSLSILVESGRYPSIITRAAWTGGTQYTTIMGAGVTMVPGLVHGVGCRGGRCGW